MAPYPLSLFSIYSRKELRNILIYALGIMCYKFALEWWNGAVVTLANERSGTSRYAKIGVLTGLNAAAQCVGSIIVAPLMKRFPIRSVLATAVLFFATMSAVLLITDAATGGKPKSLNGGVTLYGTWNLNGLFPIYIFSGVAYGSVELIRRVIPAKICGANVVKLRRMDACVHILYEVAGTAGAFTSTALISKFGYNYSSMLSPVGFFLAGCFWFCISVVDQDERRAPKSLEAIQTTNQREGFGHMFISAFRAFGKAFYKGGVIVLSHRKFIWLLPAYTLALYGHRYLENGIAPIIARQLIGVSSYSQIIVGGSNFGELLGALSVLLLSNAVPTPIPWLRADSLMLLLIWAVPYIPVTRRNVTSAWKFAGLFVPISFGWAAGDVSLAAYVQNAIGQMENVDPDVSPLGAVMAFLYVSYIVLYAILSAVLGAWADRTIRAGNDGDYVIMRLGGIQFTILAAIVITATFIPRGAFAFNPKVIEDDIDKPVDDESQSDNEKDAKHSDSLDRQASILEDVPVPAPTKIQAA